MQPSKFVVPNVILKGNLQRILILTENHSTLYVRSRSKVKSNIGPLTDDNGNTTALPQDLADSFNQFFASVFTTENLSNIPSADNIFTDRIMTDELSNISIRLTK